MVKISGRDFKEWHNACWPEGYIWGDESTIDGIDIYGEEGEEAINIADEIVFTVPSFWFIIYEGPEGVPLKEDKGDGDGVRISTLIKRWLKNKSTETIIISVPKAQVEEARALLKEKGWL